MDGQVFYEWDVETVATIETETAAIGDILDHSHSDSYAEAVNFAARVPPDGERDEITLVRDDDNGRAWAYIKDGKLPEHFEDATGRIVAKVPKRFVREVERAA